MKFNRKFVVALSAAMLMSAVPVTTYGEVIVYSPGKTTTTNKDEGPAKEVTLEEAFKKASEYEGLKVNVDVKTTKNLKAIYPLAQKYGIEDRIFYTGIGLDFVEAVKKDSPEVTYYLR